MSISNAKQLHKSTTVRKILFNRLKILLAGAACLLTGGCPTFIGRELEAILVPYAAGNELFVHNSVFFDTIVGLFR